MNLLIPSLLLGAITGLVYALSGAGLVVVYRSSKVINFAHGDIAAVGLYIAYQVSKAGAAYWIVAVVTIAASAVTGLVIGGLISLPVIRRRPVLELALATVAASFLIEGILQQTVGGEARSFPTFSNHVLTHIGDSALTVTDVVTAGVSLLAFALLGLWFERSSTGIAMRAASDNPAAARWLGIAAGRLQMVSWLVAGGLAGLAGLFLAPIYSLSPTSLGTVVLFGFAAVVVGGFESIIGALVAGLAIGITTNLTSAYISVSLVTPVMFVLMLLTLVLRPNGLFGRRPVIRV